MGGSGKGVDRPQVGDTEFGKSFIELLGKADTRTQELFNLVQPLLQQTGGQAQELLSTGGIGAQIPAIQAALGSSRAALSTANKQAEEQASRSGVTGTDFARLILDQTRQGEQQLATIPTQFTQPFLQALFAALTGSQAQAVQSQQGVLGTAGGVTQQLVQPVRGTTAAEQIIPFVPQVFGSGPTGTR